jgi:hypothetical protein
MRQSPVEAMLCREHIRAQAHAYANDVPRPPNAGSGQSESFVFVAMSSGVPGTSNTSRDIFARMFDISI